MHRFKYGGSQTFTYSGRCLFSHDFKLSGVKHLRACYRHNMPSHAFDSQLAPHIAFHLGSTDVNFAVVFDVERRPRVWPAQITLTM